MSTIKVTNLSGRGGASPNLPDGAVITGVVTATSFSGSGANLTGVANTDFVVGTAITMATGNIANVNLTKSASGAGATVGSFTGVTTYYGDGSNLTGVGETVAPHFYNPPINGTGVALVSPGIGITFNKVIFNGSGEITAKLVNVVSGAAGTTLQSWGISSITKGVTDFTLNSVASNYGANKTIQITIPEGFVVDGASKDYVGTAWTFTTTNPVNKLWTIGDNRWGILGINDTIQRSSPVQIPGLTWARGATAYGGLSGQRGSAIKTDGTLWMWGTNQDGAFGTNQSYIQRSSPVQVGSDTTWSNITMGDKLNIATKTDGTLWTWGNGASGQLGTNTAPTVDYSSPVQIPGTNWATGRRKIAAAYVGGAAIKTDGTLWTWGSNTVGALGLNGGANAHKSSPTQVPGTTWKSVKAGYYFMLATKTDGTLWSWGYNAQGQLGQNSPGPSARSSPVQIPGTSWAEPEIGSLHCLATKTDGTLWSWGENHRGSLGINLDDSPGRRSSPTQIPGTTWSTTGLHGHPYATLAVKTDGTMWAWGDGAGSNYNDGLLGQNSIQSFSSPVQIGSNTDWHTTLGAAYKTLMQADETP